jgi:hypothetical protein
VAGWNKDGAVGDLLEDSYDEQTRIQMMTKNGTKRQVGGKNPKQILRRTKKMGRKAA